MFSVILLGLLCHLPFPSSFWEKLLIPNFQPNSLSSEKRFENKILFEIKVEEHRKDLLYYMMTTRAFPASPSWLLNLTYPHVGVSALYLVLSVAIGSLI